MRDPDTVRVVALVEATPGWKVEPTSSGVRLLAPDGVSTTSAHWTPSDPRSLSNLKASLRRMGWEDPTRPPLPKPKPPPEPVYVRVDRPGKQPMAHLADCRYARHRARASRIKARSLDGLVPCRRCLPDLVPA